MSKDLAEKVPTSDSLKIGNWVRVRGAEQIEKTLVDGRLDGLPFMPEMVAYCDCCLLYTSPSPRDRQKSRMPSSA